jgi:mannitol/fructose-specific phosphotransferase system IIA component (Ntr-type)
LAGERSVAEQLIQRSGGVTVIVVDAEEQTAPLVESPPDSIPARANGAGARGTAISLGEMLSEDRIVIWEDSVSRRDIFERMVNAVTGNNAKSTQAILEKLEEREKTGSTFLNEGVALPHARIEGLDGPKIAFGLTHGGVLDSPTEAPIEAVFMLLSPSEGASSHLQMLAKAGRMLQSRELRRRLQKARTPADALEEIRNWEQAPSPVK